MDSILTVILQLVLLALGAVAALFSASYARRAASFDLTRDFDALAAAVAKLQQLARSEKMSKVRAAALVPEAPAASPQVTPSAPLTHDQLRALARGRNGSVQ